MKKHTFPTLRLTLLAAIVLLVFLWIRQDAGATHGEILHAVRDESAALQKQIDRRADEILDETRKTQTEIEDIAAMLKLMDAQLSRMDNNLERLYRLATLPPMPKTERIGSR